MCRRPKAHVLPRESRRLRNRDFDSECPLMNEQRNRQAGAFSRLRTLSLSQALARMFHITLFREPSMGRMLGK